MCAKVDQLPLFPNYGRGVGENQPNSLGHYIIICIPIERIPKKGWMTILYIATF